MTESGKHARKALYGLDPMEKMLSVKGTRMLLLYIYEHPGCTKKDARDWLFDGKRRDSAFKALIEYGALVDDDGKTLRLTEKGAFMANIFLAMRTAEEKGEFPLPENVRVPGSRKRCCRGSAGRLGPDRDRG